MNEINKNTDLNRVIEPNIISGLTNTALAGLALVIGGAFFYLGNLLGTHHNSKEVNDLKAYNSQQAQKIETLTDTILAMKLSRKDTITSIQEPARVKP